MKLKTKAIIIWLVILLAIAAASFVLGYSAAGRQADAAEWIELPTAPPAAVIGPVSLGEFELTAYCPCSRCCGKYADGITATGTEATEGRTVAVDPEVIPYGTELWINGQAYIAEDCGGAIKGNRVDIYFDSHSEALAFGRQAAEVYVLGGV